MIGQISFFDGSKRFHIDKPVRLIELFAGIGSQAKALERLNVDFEHYRVCEFDKFAVTSYNAIHGTNFVPSDITKLSASDLGITQTDKYQYIMTYSFPCQDLSKAGKQQGMGKDSGTRSGLLWEVERLLTECNELPQVLLMENVPDVLSNKFRPDYYKWCDFLESKGYKNYYKVLNAKDYGIPQNRERCFMVSLYGDYYYDFPEPQPLTLRLKDLLEPIVDEKYYLTKDTIKSLNTHKERHAAVGHGFGWKPTFGDGVAHAIKTEGGYRPDSNFVMEASSTMGGGHREPKIVEPIIGAIRGRNADNPTSRKSGLTTKQMLEIKADGISNTLTTVQKDNVVIEPRIFDIYNNKELFNGICGTLTTNGNTSVRKCGTFGIYENCRIRKLIPLECWRLMDFDDEDYYKARDALNNTYHKGRDRASSQQYKQAGNSIVVSVLMEIFKGLL